MNFRHLFLAAFVLIAIQSPTLANQVVSEASFTTTELPGPGDKEKKKKKNKDEEEDENKMSKTKYKPQKHAKNSAKNARRALKLKEKQVAARAKTRNFFHKMFNTKYGKPVNFRKKRRRNRWKRGR